jgi:hypothetical protein
MLAALIKSRREGSRLPPVGSFIGFPLSWL